jgi:hypothetical protein
MIFTIKPHLILGSAVHVLAVLNMVLKYDINTSKVDM